MSQSFQLLRKFIEKSMKMSHVYQPVMLKCLLEHGGKASKREIASSILQHDDSQLEYYEKITTNMVGRVLASHGIVNKKGSEFELAGFSELSQPEVAELASICDTKLQEFIAKRGTLVWSHRKRSDGYISGTIRYEVLKRAKFRCELCGISAEVKALEVDHIEPRNKGGVDDIENFQALCYSCNSMKRDRDNTDFRGMDEAYEHREKECIFCDTESDRILYRNRLCYAIKDGFPVTHGHMLIIPRRHTADYFDLSRPEMNSVQILLDLARDELSKVDKSITGFNVGVNNGQSAGQTVMHCHIHLIPRRDGDMKDPSGGVRHVIPSKGNYLN
jgi:ATP adenylyltransferase